MGLLLKKADVGESPDFEALYERYRRLVRSVLFKLALRDDVDDLVQETFLKVWRSKDSVREPAKLKSWVVRIAVNVARDSGRKGRRFPSSVPLEEGNSPATESRPEEQQRLLNGLAELSAAHREVLVLHCLEGLSLEESAESLGLSVGTVKSRLHYAKSRLHAYLSKTGGFL